MSFPTYQQQIQQQIIQQQEDVVTSVPVALPFVLAAAQQDDFISPPQQPQFQSQLQVVATGAQALTVNTPIKFVAPSPSVGGFQIGRGIRYDPATGIFTLVRAGIYDLNASISQLSITTVPPPPIPVAQAQFVWIDMATMLPLPGVLAGTALTSQIPPATTIYANTPSTGSVRVAVGAAPRRIALVPSTITSGIAVSLTPTVNTVAAIATVKKIF